MPGYVATDKLAVHADALARNLQLLDKTARDSLKALLHKVDACLLIVLADATAEKVVCVKRGSHVADELQTQ